MTWQDETFIGLDFETSGSKPEYALQAWRLPQGEAWLTSTAILRRVDGRYERLGPGLNAKGFAAVPAAQRHAKYREQLRAVLVEAAANGWTIVGWNIVFDIQWLLALGLEAEVFACKWMDGMLLWRHHFIEPEYEMARPNKKSYGLKTAVAEMIPAQANYAEDVSFHSEEPEDREKLDAYNVRDTRFSLRLTKHFYGQLEPKQLACALIEMSCLPLVAKANLDGMLIDTIYVRELQQWLLNAAATQLKKLAPHGVTEKIVRSPTQLAVLLFDTWGLPVLKENVGAKTGKTTRGTDKEVLHELAFADPRAKELRLYREALNNKTKFADAPLTAADYNGDGHARPAAIVFGTYSGRLTYSSKQMYRWVDAKGKNRKTPLQTGFALHQMKRDKEFRQSVKAPPGHTIMEFDASGQEFRWMAIASGDKTMLDLCLPGEDPHAFMGGRITGIEYRDVMSRVKAGDNEGKDARQLGKVGNLSLQYRTSARKLRSVARVQYNLPMELPEAQRIHKTYQQTYQGVPKYWEKQIAMTKRLGYVETYAGRRVLVEGNWNGKGGWSMGSTSINYRIQGTGADQKYLALSVLRPYLRRINAYFAWDLHDGIYLFVPDEHVARAAVEIRYLLNNLPYQRAWGFTPPIPLPWDCKVGKSWGSLREYAYV